MPRLLAVAASFTTSASACRSVASTCSDSVGSVRGIGSVELADSPDVASAWSEFMTVNGAFIQAFATASGQLAGSVDDALLLFDQTDQAVGGTPPTVAV